jgi:hypothetical protein
MAKDRIYLSDIAYYEPKNWWMVAVVSVVGLFMMVFNSTVLYLQAGLLKGLS